MKVLQPIKTEYLAFGNDHNTILYTYGDVEPEELQEEAKRLTYKAPYCGCPHDCCGCFNRQWAEVKSENTIEVLEVYNY